MDGNRYELQYGDYLMIPPETRHHPIFHSTGQDYRRFVLWISRPYYEALVARSEDFAYSFRQVEEKNSTISGQTLSSFRISRGDFWT